MTRSDWIALIVCGALMGIVMTALLWGWFADAKGL
jgi:hypothetical protein